MDEQFWTIQEAAEAWGVKVVWARRIAPRVPGVQREVSKGKYIWLIPVNTPKPENKPKGRPAANTKKEG